MDSMIHDIFNKEKCNSLSMLLDKLHSLLQHNTLNTDSVSSQLIDQDILEEIRGITACGDMPFFFCKTLRDFRCLIEDRYFRIHELCFRYNGPKKLSITSINMPYSTIQEQQYSRIEDIVATFKKRLESLTEYFYELERIDTFCTVMEPINATFKDDYRRIYLDERTWLHVEVTSDGLARNVHLLGSGEYWHQKLQSGLLIWSHDKDIVDNIMNVFDLIYFPTPAKPKVHLQESMEEGPVCNICLCTELPDNPGVPLPLCQNKLCGVYFHRNCLFQWLISSSGGRNPSFGVASGDCPTCLKPISCSEN